MNENGPLVLDSTSTSTDVGVGELTFIGTATTLIRYGGFTILTDPNFLHKGDRAYVGLGVTTKRLTQPAMGIDDLPSLDLVLLSHHHGDHFDAIAARDLDKRLPIVTEPHSAEKLRSQGFRRPIPLKTWETQEIRKGSNRLTITATPAKHAPEPLQRLLPSVMGSILDFSLTSERHLRIYVTGDTLLHDQLADIPRRYPDIDLCIVHLGGTRIAGILLTMDAVQGVKALQVIGPRVAIPVHYDDYTLFRSPLSDFKRLAAQSDLTCDIHYLAPGDIYRFEATNDSQGPHLTDKPHQ
jgi:L-ascorbate metabolism protein UlaG (beta-lactamase superfamily)